MIITHARPSKKVCQQCPLYKKKHVSTYHIPMEYHPTPDGNVAVVFRGDGPRSDDDAEGQVFASDTEAGDYLRDIIKRLNGGSLDGIGFDYAAKCASKKGRAPSKEVVSLCSRYAARNVESFSPKVVVLLGHRAIRSVFPKAPRMHKCVGKSKKKGGVVYLMAESPYKLYRTDDKEQHRAFRKTVRQAMKQAGLGKHQTASFEDEVEDAGKGVLVKTVKEVRNLVNTILALPKGSVVACDTEGLNLNRVRENDITSIQLSYDGEIGYVILLKHPKTPFFPKELKQVYKELVRLFTASRVKVKGKWRQVKEWFWLFQNGFGYDLHAFRRDLKCEITNNPVFDTMQAAYLLDENRLAGSNDPKSFYYPDGERGLGINTLVKHYLGEAYAYDDEDKEDRGNSINWTLERFVKYGAEDVWKLWRLFMAMLQDAEEQGYRKKLLRLLKYLYAPTNLMTVDMEHNGFLADIDHLRLMRSPKTSPMLAEMRRLEDALKQSKHAKRANERIWKKESGGVKTIWGGTPWRLELTKKDHLRLLFFDVMGLEPISFTSKTETPQVNKNFFAAYGKWDADGKPLNEAAIVSDWSGIQKLMSAFINAVYDWIHPDHGHPDMKWDGRVRGRFRTTATNSGRVAHKDPNMGQFPRSDTYWKKQAKNIFIAPKGRVILASDLKANEVRWCCIQAGDPIMGDLFWSGKKASDRYRTYTQRLSPKLHKLYREYLRLEKLAKFDGKKPLNKEAKRLKKLAKEGGKKLERILFLRMEAALKGDIHKQTASAFFGVPIGEVTKVLRTSTKAIVFGYMYGRSIGSIARQIDKEWAEAKVLCDGFDERYPKFAQRLHSWPIEAEERGYVESPIGRRRRFHSRIWEEAPEWMAAKARRQAKNAPTQGIASDACLIAASLLRQWIVDNGKQGVWKIINIVHDAIYLEVPYEDIALAAKIMEWALTTGLMEYMTKHFGVKFVAPMECDFGVGVKWGELRDWDFSQPHFELILAQVAEDHKKKWGVYPKGAQKYLSALPEHRKKAA